VIDRPSSSASERGPLRTIIYVSSAAWLLNDDELEALLVDAQTHNALHDITGVLIYGQGNFMQCIEGPVDAIELVFKRILTSRQHRDIITLMDEPIASRGFGQWHMGLAHGSDSDLLRLASAQWHAVQGAVQAQVAALPPCLGMQLLQHMWRELMRGGTAG
jgi:hypothetical protein